MKRRKVLAGPGSLTTAAAAGIGRRAFTGVSADRAVVVKLDDDADTLQMFDPGLRSSTNDAFASCEVGLLVLNFAETTVGG